MAKQMGSITNLQMQVDELKEKLGISDMDAQDLGTVANIERESLGKTEFTRLDVEAEYALLATKYASLTNYTRTELKRLMATTSPDNLLQRLLEELSVS